MNGSDAELQALAGCSPREGVESVFFKSSRRTLETPLVLSPLLLRFPPGRTAPLWLCLCLFAIVASTVADAAGPLRVSQRSLSAAAAAAPPSLAAPFFARKAAFRDGLGFLKKEAFGWAAAQRRLAREKGVAGSWQRTAAASPGSLPEALPAAASTEDLVAQGGGVRILGVGAAVPDTRLSNEDLQQVVDTDDEWIKSRTGIRSRRVLQQGESLKDLAVAAAAEALAAAERVSPSPPGRAPFDIVVCATSSPDDLFGDGPAVAAQVLEAFFGKDAPRAKGISAGPPAFGLTAACSGFVAGLISANMFLTAPSSPYRRALVVGADALSRWVDWSDRNTCVLFGDGAGAALVARASDLAAKNSEASEGRAKGEGQAAEDSAAALGLLSYSFHSDGAAGSDKLNVSFLQRANPLRLKRAPVEVETVNVGGGSYGCLQMKGRDVFRFATTTVPNSIAACLAKAGVAASDLDFLVLHQANKRIMAVAAEKLGLRPEQVLSNVEAYGNTSAASIPICLAEAIRKGQVKRGSLLALSGFGAGLTWANAVLRFG